MSLWRNIRAELAGAWRSLRYDLDGGPASRGTAEPDVTSTGMNTFPGSLVLPPAEPVANEPEPSRRLVTAAAFCALALFGAAGSYLVATTAFAGRMTDPPATAPEVTPPPPRPPAFDAAPGAVPKAAVRPAKTGHAGRGRTSDRRHTPPPVPATTTTTILVTPPPATENIRPETPGTEPPECDCDVPPVPTPTVPDLSAPASPPPSGSTGPGPVVPATAGPDGSPRTAPGDDPRQRPPWD